MAIKGGYILVSRRIDGSKISEFPPHVREIWLYLLRRANHADRIVSGMTIKRGQLLTSYKEIINDLSWFVGYRKEGYKKHHCETATKLLTKELMVTTTKTTRGILVTVCNYDYYQNSKNYETDSESYKKATRKLQSTDTINKELKELKELKEEDTVLSDFDFDRFWNLYDKKVGREKTLKKWTSLNQSERDKIFTTLPAYIRSTPDKKYRKNPEVYLNNKSWNDEIITPQPPKRGMSIADTANMANEIVAELFNPQNTIEDHGYGQD